MKSMHPIKNAARVPCLLHSFVHAFSNEADKRYFNKKQPDLNCNEAQESVD